MPKRIKDITKMKATWHRIIGKPFILEPANRIPRVFSYMHETCTTKQRTRSTRLHTAVETSSDPTYVDGTKISLRADILLLWADIPQSALGSVTSQHPSKCGTQQCRPQTVSARSIGYYAWGCISDILSPENAWGYGYDPSNLRLCDAGGQSIGSAKEHPRDKDKGILMTHITAQHIVT